MSKKVAVVLSGCGVYDGSEAYETVLTLLYLSQAGAEVKCFAPELTIEPVNHISGEQMTGESRNTLLEAARLVRGEIANITEANANDFDALIVPGGFGAAKNLSNYATAGANCEVQADFLQFAKSMYESKKPIGLICIAPTMAAHICGSGVSCTIGNDADTAKNIEAMGAKHVECSVSDIHTDEANKLVTTPAYMLAQSISEAATGIEKLVKKVLSMS